MSSKNRKDESQRFNQLIEKLKALNSKSNKQVHEKEKRSKKTDILESLVDQRIKEWMDTESQEEPSTSTTRISNENYSYSEAPKNSKVKTTIMENGKHTGEESIFSRNMSDCKTSSIDQEGNSSKSHVRENNSKKINQSETGFNEEESPLSGEISNHKSRKFEKILESLIETRKIIEGNLGRQKEKTNLPKTQRTIFYGKRSEYSIFKKIFEDTYNSEDESSKYMHLRCSLRHEAFDHIAYICPGPGSYKEMWDELDKQYNSSVSEKAAGIVEAIQMSCPCPGDIESLKEFYIKAKRIFYQVKKTGLDQSLNQSMFVVFKSKMDEESLREYNSYHALSNPEGDTIKLIKFLHHRIKNLEEIIEITGSNRTSGEENGQENQQQDYEVEWHQHRQDHEENPQQHQQKYEDELHQRYRQDYEEELQQHCEQEYEENLNNLAPAEI